MGASPGRTVKIGSISCNVCVEEVVPPPYRIETFFLGGRLLQNAIDFKTKKFPNLENAAMEAAKEIFYVSTIDENKFN